MHYMYYSFNKRFVVNIFWIAQKGLATFLCVKLELPGPDDLFLYFCCILIFYCGPMSQF